MSNTPQTIANRITLIQVLMYLVSVPLFLLFQKTAYLLTGWGALLMANTAMFIITTRWKPSLFSLALGEFLKYFIFSAILYLSTQLQPQAWPYVLYGVILGHIAYISTCIMLKERHVC